MEQRRVARQFSSICDRFRVVQYVQDAASSNLILKPQLARVGCTFEETIVVNADYEGLTNIKGKVHRDKYLQIRNEAMAVAAPQYRSLIATLRLSGSHSIYMAPQEVHFAKTASAVIAQTPVQEWLSSDAKEPMALEVPLSFQHDDFILSIAACISEFRLEGFQKFLVLTINLAQPVCNLHESLPVSLLTDLLCQAFQKYPLCWQEICNIISYDDLISVFSGSSRSLLEPVLWRCFMALMATSKPIACVMSLAGAGQERVFWEPVLERLVSAAASVDCDLKLMFLYNNESPVTYLGPTMEAKLDVNDSRLRESIEFDIMRLDTDPDDPGLHELRQYISAAVSDLHGESLRLASFARYIRTPTLFPQQQLSNGYILLSKQVKLLPEILRHVPDSSKDCVRRILFLVAQSFRPLAISELVDGMRIIASSEVATSPFSQQHFHLEIKRCLITYLSSLLRIDHDVVRLIHPDVKHLLEENETTPDSWYRPQVQWQLELAKICILCIDSSLTSDATEEQLESTSMIIDEQEGGLVAHTSMRRPFLEYSILNWPLHLIQALSSHSDEASIQQAIALLSNRLITKWLSLQVILRHPAKHSSLVPSLKLSPLKLAEEYGLSLPCALKVCLQALDSFVALDGKEDVAIVWSIAKVIGMDPGAKVWEANLQRISEDPTELLECIGQDPSIAFELLLAIDKNHLQRYLPGLIYHEICLGGHSVLDYVLEQTPVSDGSLFQFDNGHTDHSPLGVLKEEATRGLPLKDDSTRIFRIPLASLGMAQFLLAAKNRVKDILEGADHIFALAALYAAVGGGHRSITRTIVGLKLGLDDEALLNASAIAADSGFVGVLDELLPHLNPGHLNHLIGGARTLLHLSSRKGFIRMASTLLDQGAVIDVTDYNGTTPFLEAVEFGRLPIVQRLSKQARDSQRGMHGAPEEMADSFTAIDIPNEQGLTPLISSPKNGFKSIFDILLKAAVQLEVTDLEGKNLAHLAVEAGYSDLLEQVLKRNKRVMGQDNDDGETPLQLAVLLGDAKCVSCLLENGAHGDLTALLQTAIEENYQRVFEALLPYGIEEKVALGESLHYAALNGRPEMCSILLNSGADKNYKDNSGNRAIGLAAYFGHCTVMEILLLRRVELEGKDSWGHTALCDAVRMGFQGACKLLLDAGADVLAEDNERKIPLDHVATDNQPLFSLLWKSWVATLDRDERKTRMAERLEHAIDNGNSKLVGQLLLEGVETSSKQLAAAIRMRYAAIVSLLIEHGANLDDVKMENSDVPLHHAAFYCDSELVDVLLTKGKANINQTGGRWWSALCACLKSRNEYEAKKHMLQELIHRGANVADKGGPKGTLLQVALEKAPVLAQYLVDTYGDSMNLGKGDVEGRLPAHIAAVRNNDSVLLQLPSHSFETRDYQQRLPSHFAAAGGSLAALSLFMTRSTQGTDFLFETDIDGWNVLHWACRQEDSFVVEWILRQAGERRAELCFCKTKGPWVWLPQDVAIRHGNEHMLITLLRDIPEADKEDHEYLTLAGQDWQLTTASCDSCFCEIYGERHKCSKCYDYDLCFKCIRNAGLFHEEHEFKEL